MIISNLNYVQDKPTIIPTFLGTVDAVSNFNDVPKEDVKLALSRMMEKGYIYQKEFNVTFTKRVRSVAVNWDKLIEDGLWIPKGKIVW